jgi:hypothetical protein
VLDQVDVLVWPQVCMEDKKRDRGQPGHHHPIASVQTEIADQSLTLVSKSLPY